jgi:hypothetical protein
MELFFDVLEPGVAGPDPWKGASEFVRNRCDKLKRSPKLFLPVEVEVLVDASVGVGRASSLGMFRKELNVEDLPRIPSLARVGEDLVEADDPVRRRGTAGAAKCMEDLARALRAGDGKGEASPWLVTSSADGERRDFTAEDSTPSVRTELVDCDCRGPSIGELS